MKSINPETIRDAVQSRADDIIEWTKALIRFPSENRPPNGNEAAVQKFIEDECRKLGLGVDVFAPDEIEDKIKTLISEEKLIPNKGKKTEDLTPEFRQIKELFADENIEAWLSNKYLENDDFMKPIKKRRRLHDFQA